MNRFKNRIYTFCEERASQAMQPALEKAEQVSYESMSEASRKLLRSVAEYSISNGEPAPDAYQKIVQQVFGPSLGRISSDMRVPLMIAAIFMEKKKWISFHSSYIDSFLKYYNSATYSVSKAYVESFVEVATEKKKRKKASKAEKSLSPTVKFGYSDNIDDYED
jgi:hypothetical protein